MKTQITRLTLCGFLSSLAIILIMVGTGRAASRPLSIEELQDKADFVVIGTFGLTTPRYDRPLNTRNAPMSNLT